MHILGKENYCRHKILWYLCHKCTVCISERPLPPVLFIIFIWECCYISCDHVCHFYDIIAATTESIISKDLRRTKWFSIVSTLLMAKQFARKLMAYNLSHTMTLINCFYCANQESAKYNLQHTYKHSVVSLWAFGQLYQTWYRHKTNYTETCPKLINIHIHVHHE